MIQEPFTLVGKARQIAAKAHSNQWRRDGITPYIVHPMQVALRLSHYPEEVRATAWLHDVLEDSAYKAGFLRENGIPESVIEAVVVLTKREGVLYTDYIEQIKAHPFARHVKIADILCNLADNPTNNQIRKYAEALLILVDPA
jgi:(p)ppGpp synthase/HD superfamily hydrolase